MSKQKLGQFYTKNYEYILQSLEIPENILDEKITIIEPFAGNGDLFPFVKKCKIECYDIQPKKKNIIKRDTLLNPPDYKGKFVLTNPPYLARNKSEDKTIYDKYNCNDLYKCFIECLIRDVCLGGIIIIPLNFISSIRKNDVVLRARFLEKYNIIRLNIFEERVFDDTSYTVCSFLFIKKEDDVVVECFIYPEKRQIEFHLSESNNYIVGGEIYKLPYSKKYKVDRATKKTKDESCITNILLKCIDDSIKNKICLSLVKNEERYIDKTQNLSGRSYATLVIVPKINKNKQKKLVDKFNEYLENEREKYNSLFLTNYRESNSIARKRISFGLAFQICSYFLKEL
jgi:hypothetical protein